MAFAEINSIAVEEARVHACWMGKSIGGTLGLPAEGKMERLDYRFYDPVPTIAPPNDDLELQLVWLHMIEMGGSFLTRANFAAGWLEHIHYMWDEYGWCRWNLRRGVPLASVGTFENFFQASMGAPIRSEIWACLFAGDPASAAYYAALDASLDHGTEGMAGEVFLAVMQSHVAAGMEISAAMALARSYLPVNSETARAISQVCEDREGGVAAWGCWQNLLARHGAENFTHAPLNVALTVWALLYGEGDFEKSILLAVNGGYDTDCTAASVGATLGLALGPEGIPHRWSQPIGEGVFVGPGILGITPPRTLQELTQRTVALIGKLEPMSWDSAVWTQAAPPVNLAGLPGTISLYPLDGSECVPWANGELPERVKQAGGAEWDLESGAQERRGITCLVRAGACLFMDGRQILQCPSGLPYVPAPHRSPDGSLVELELEIGKHRVRLELGSSAPNQEASVILTYANRHICPWTCEEIPHPALLESP